jgi:hypothetical protein
VRATQSGASPKYLAGRDWVDQKVGRHATVTALLGPAGDLRSSTVQWWDVSFFNESVSRVYAQDGQIYDQGFARAFSVDPATGTAPGLALKQLAIVATADRRVRWRGQHVLAVFGGLELVRLPARPRAEWTASAADPSGLTPPTQRTTIRLYADGTAGPLSVNVAATVAPNATTPARFSVATADTQQRGVAPADGRPASVRLRVQMPAQGFVALDLRATGSAPVTLYDVRLQR